MSLKFGPMDERNARAQFIPEPFPESVLNCGGVIGRVMDYTLSIARHPNRVLAFSGALALMSFVCGRRYKTEGNTWPNLYIVAVGRSGVGKEAARTTNFDIIKRIGAVENVADSFRSGEGLEDAMLQDARLLFQYDEFDTLLRMAQGDSGCGETIFSNVLTIYSKADKFMVRRRIANNKFNQTNGQPKTCTHPSLTIYGTAVAARFYETISDRVATSGLYPRFIVMDAGRRTPAQRVKWHKPDQELIDEIANLNSSERNPNIYDEDHRWASKDLPDKPPQPTTVGMSDAAAEMLGAFAAEADAAAESDMADGVSANLWTRAEEKAEKLALLFAVSRNGRKEGILIDDCDISRAITLVRYTTRNAIMLAESYRYENEFQKDRVTVLKLIAAAGEGGIGRSELLRRSRLDKDSLMRVIDALSDGDEIDQFEDGDGKKKATRYRLPR